MARHPILDVFERITTRAPFIRPIALELFCGAGEGQAKAYADMCEYFEGWDMREEKIAELRRNIPRAMGKVCDVYTSLLQPREITDIKEFNVILVDNSFLKASAGGFEHFDIFPGLYNMMNPATCFVVFTVCPDPFGYAEPRKDAIRKAFANPEEFFKDWDAARDKFYKLPPLDPANLPKMRPVSSVRLQDMEEIYRERFESDGWVVPYTFSCMRSKAAGYVMVEAKRAPVTVSLPAGDGTYTEHAATTKPAKRSRKQ